VQTRRDQLQAYRFQNRRALAALVTGQPNVVEPPMRRLTVLTIAGIMIAILVAVVFALIGKFKPDPGDSWKAAGAVIIDNHTGATYLYDSSDNTLHPVANYTSAVLAIQGNAQAHAVHVDAADLRSAKAGYVVGIRGLPYTLPPKPGLVRGPWTVCSATHTDATTDQVSVRTAVTVDADPAGHRLAADSPVLVRGVHGGATYVLVDGQRLAVTADVAAALQLTAAPLPVGTAFLDGVPAGPPLQAPQVPHAGDPSTLLPSARVGQLVRESSSGQVAVVLADGFQLLSSKVQVAVMQTLRVGPGNGVQLPQLPVADNVVGSNLSRHDGTALRDALGKLPAQIAAPDPASQNAPGVCAVYRSTTPQFALARGRAAPGAVTGTITESTASATRGQADEVVVPSSAAALIASDDAARTLFVVDPSGRKFALAGDARARIGYGDAKPQVLARQLLNLVPSGPAMDPAAAARPAGN
jgi:type VII secretion protein EccB